MSPVIASVLTAVVSNGVALAVIAYLCRKMFEAALDRRAKLYERELDLLHRKQFHQFSRVYDEQATVIKETYASLVSLYQRVLYLAFKHNMYKEHPEFLDRYRKPEADSPFAWERYLRSLVEPSPEDEMAQELQDEASAALKDFQPRRIYFQPDLAAQIDIALQLILHVASSFKTVNYSHRERDVIAPEVITTWEQSIVACQHAFPLIEAAFRAHFVSPVAAEA